MCFSRFAKDLAKHALPSLSWLVPNGCDDAHDCPIGTFDSWLKTEIATSGCESLLSEGGKGSLIIVFDENSGDGNPNCDTLVEGKGCGGQVELVVVSPFSKQWLPVAWRRQTQLQQELRRRRHPAPSGARSWSAYVQSRLGWQGIAHGRFLQQRRQAVRFPPRGRVPLDNSGI